MGRTLIQYRIRCTTDNKDEYAWIEEGVGSVPTTCPTDTGHTVTTIIEDNRMEELEHTVKEETIKTGGNFQSTTMSIDALPDQVSSTSISWDHPVSAMVVKFITETENKGDFLSLSVNKDTIFGALTSQIVASTAWASQNYTSGDTVTYFGKTYTCILDTVSNEAPSDATYWKVGYKVPLSTGASSLIKKGYNITIGSDDLDRIISIDGNDIYTKTGPAGTHNASTYVKVTVYMVKDFEIGPAFGYSIGDSKIGGSHIPSGSVILLEYHNKHATDTKHFVGSVEYLY